MVGSCRLLRTWLGKIPFTGTPIHSAQADVQSQIERRYSDKRRGTSPKALPVSTATNAPGDALLTGVREHVDNALNIAKPQIDQIETARDAEHRGPRRRPAMVDPRGSSTSLMA